MTYKVERVHCIGAPCGDFWHEVEEGWPIPNGMGMPDLDDSTKMNYFKRDEHGAFQFTHQEDL